MQRAVIKCTLPSAVQHVVILLDRIEKIRALYVFYSPTPVRWSSAGCNYFGRLEPFWLFFFFGWCFLPYKTSPHLLQLFSRMLQLRFTAKLQKCISAFTMTHVTAVWSTARRHCQTKQQQNNPQSNVPPLANRMLCALYACEAPVTTLRAARVSMT